MGVGICATAVWPRQGILTGRIKRNEVFAAIESAVRAQVTDPTIQKMVSFDIDEDEQSLRAVVHVVAEPIYFIWRGKGTVEVQAKTSTLGAGYHAWILQVLDSIAKQEKVKWTFEEGEFPGSGASSFEFESIQTEMGLFVKKLADVIERQFVDEHSCTLVNVAITSRIPDGFAGILTPSGPLDREWLRRAARGEELSRVVEDFFIWPRRQQDAMYWRRVGESLLWTEIHWHPPENTEERDTAKLALECFERARAIDRQIPLPMPEIKELVAILKHSPETASEPAAVGIGYARRVSTFRMPGDWSLKLPGYYYEFDENEGSVQGFWFAGRVVRFSSLTVTGKNGQRPSARELWADQSETTADSRVLFSSDERMCCATMETDLEEDGTAHCVVYGRFCADGQVGMLSVTLTDPRDEAWALQVFHTVKPPSRGDDEEG